jgi:hypothetical protein
MKMRFLRDNGLTIVLGVATLTTLGGMLLTGWQVYNQELLEHSTSSLGLWDYAKSGHFLSAVFENWESEFLQMSAYVVLTAFLFQRGSAESNDPDEISLQDEDPATRADDPEVPWPVKAGGIVRSVYAYSLGLALAALFLASFLLHLCYSADAANAEATRHGQMPVTITGHITNTQFWFESFQNWQSEFLSTGLLVLLSIFLRFKGSPESKPVAAPHRETGG